MITLLCLYCAIRCVKMYESACHYMQTITRQPALLPRSRVLFAVHESVNQKLAPHIFVITIAKLNFPSFRGNDSVSG